jgi:hypothetical protein
MYTLCNYTCSYCGRQIETSFVTLGKRHYHALENESGEKDERSCYDLSQHGTKSLHQDIGPEDYVHGVESAQVPA